MNQSIRENFKPTVFVIIALLLLAVSAYPQHRLGGKVVEVVDGKTIVIELFSGGKITAELQHIEVPEPEQQLHQTAIEHLQKLVFAKTVEFRPLRMIKARTVGQILLNGTDVSQQMIRDGAAWYAAEKTGQEQAEIELYQINETQAKTEKRGVWSIEGLKPAWQVRAEAEANRKLQEKLALEAVNTKSAFVREMQRKQKQTVRTELSSESQMLSATSASVGKLPANIKFVGGLLVGYEPSTKLGLVLTPLYQTQIANKNDVQQIAFQIFYLYYDGDEKRGRRSMFVVGIDSISKDYKFLKNNNLVVTADNQKIIIGKAKRVTRQSEQGNLESLAYEVKKPVLAKIAKAQNVSIKVGNFSKELNSEILAALSNLLKVAE